MAFLKKEKVAGFFLNEANPYSQKRSIKGSHVGIVFGVLVVSVMGLGSYFDSKNAKEHDAREAKKVVEDSSLVSLSQSARASEQSQAYVELKPSSTYGRFSGASVGGSRQNSASQLIKRGESVYDTLPIGTLIKVRLIGKVESADKTSPVIALVTERSISPSGTVVIPEGAKLIGQGQIDTARERLQVSFGTLVFPEGEQFSLSGTALMPDGSSGIAGDFSSGAIKRYASQFVSHFIGGMAEGMKDRQAGGQMGIPFEPGGLKNGVLNGVAQSSLDYAKSSSEVMGRVQASMSVGSGQEFVVYLSREFRQ